MTDAVASRGLALRLRPPETLSATTAYLLALLPLAAAGAVFFRLQALIPLLIAAVCWLVAWLGLRQLGWFGRNPDARALVITAGATTLILLPPGMAWYWAAGAAAGSVLVATIVAWAGMRLHPSAVVYALLLLLLGPEMSHYLSAFTLVPMSEPVRLWETYSSYGRSLFSAASLYVGDVPGPVFATSMMAVGMALAWLWLCRRVSPLTLAGFAVGVLVLSWLLTYPISLQLVSGPTWFAAGFLLADHRMLPRSAPLRLLAGLLAGAAAIGLRQLGLAIEVVPICVLGTQLLLQLPNLITRLIRADPLGWRKLEPLGPGPVD